MNAPAASKKSLFIVFITVFLDLVGFGIIIPIQPFFAEKLGATPTVVTLLGASYSLMQFLFAPVWGRLSDRVGRRPVMLVSIFITAVGYLLFGFAGTLPMLFCARMLAGFGSANIGTAQAIIADSTTPQTRAKGMGIIGAAFGLGFILGPAFGALLGQKGLAVPAFGAAAFSTFNLILAYFILPETNPVKLGTAKALAPTGHSQFSLAALKHASRHVNVKELFCVYLFYSIAFSMMEQSLGLFVGHSFVDLNAEGGAKRAALLTGYYLIVVGITATIIQGGLIGRLVSKFGERTLMITGMVLIGVSFFLIPLIGSLGSYRLFINMAWFTAAGTALLNPSAIGLLSRSVGYDEQGGTLGLSQSLSALGRVVGPAFAGWLFERHVGAPFWLGAILMLVTLSFAMKVRPPELTKA